MRRFVWLLSFAFLLAPSTSAALELHWNAGADTLTFTEARTCTLVVQTETGEASLPHMWQLLWVSDSSAIEFRAFYSSVACEQGVAQISNFNRIWVPAGGSSDELAARFCSGDSARATTARYILDLASNSHGKFKIVSLDPDDSTAVIESGEVTFNGGVDADYAPTILSASSVHQSLELSVQSLV